MRTILEQLNDEMADLVEKVKPSLVQVRNDRYGAGAGTIWHPQGLIITNAHVVEHGSPQVVVPDGPTLPAKVMAVDKSRDLAALTVDAVGLPTIDLGDSRNLRPGQWVMAIGHPWGVRGAATAGVIIGTGLEQPRSPLETREWIAVSLPLRPGNSGGPLIDVYGRLLGINTMMTGPDVGMSVPVHVVKRFLKETLGVQLSALPTPLSA